MKKAGAGRADGKDGRSKATKTKTRAARAVTTPTPASGGASLDASTQVAAGVLHEVPTDLQVLLTSDAALLATWNDLTPIQRNEWICWVTLVKKPETRADHLRRLSSQLREGERQPCCWPGCPHRRPKARKWFRNKADQ